MLFVDMPLSPSGVTGVTRRHRAVGFERELEEVSEFLRVVKEGSHNVLAVIVAPYGWGKSELLDEVESIAEAEGFEVVRTALTLSSEYGLEKLAVERKGDGPLLVLVDEADEVSRLAAAHRLGAINDEKFREMIHRAALSIRALLEPRSYPHLVGDPRRLVRIGILVALTPQLYYTILKNLVPDVFDISTGRVYREIVLDTRFPFWQFVEMVKARLAAYSTAERIKMIENGADPLYPFTLTDLATLYHIALRKGEVGPRPLLKMAASLLVHKQRGRRTAELIRELGIDADVDDEILELAVAAVPHGREEYRDVSRRVYVYRIPYSDKEAMAVAREHLALRGLNLDLKDPKNVSFEPYIYYSIKEENNIIIYIFFEENIKELEQYMVSMSYIISEDIARRIWGQMGSRAVVALAKEYGERLESPSFLLEEVARALGAEGVRLRLCCGQLVWSNSLGIREGYLLFHVDNEEELERVADVLAQAVRDGVVREYVVDMLSVFISSRVLLSDTIKTRLVPVIGAYWKTHYQEPASNYLTVVIYGADRVERLKQELVMLSVDKLLKREPREPEFVREIRLGRERAREGVLRYTLALKRGKERKQLALLKVAEQMARGETPEGLSSYPAVERIVLAAFDSQVHEKELKSLIARLFPVNLWRDFREDDLVELMKLRGLLIPKGDMLLKYSEEEARRHLAELASRLESASHVVVERQTPYGPLKISRRLNMPSPSTVFEGRAEYSARLLELHRLLIEAKEEAERVRKELEHEMETRLRTLRRAEQILKKMPQRAKVFNPIVAAELDLNREEELAQRYDEVMRLWREVEPKARELGDAVDVDSDMKALLAIPTPWLDEYLTELKIYAADVRRRYAEAMQRREAEEKIRQWLSAKGITCSQEAEECIRQVASRFSIDAPLLRAVALRGLGAELSPGDLAKELGRDEAHVERQLETLYRAGMLSKKYVT